MIYLFHNFLLIGYYSITENTAFTSQCDFANANSFKPWKKNFLAECLKCESMSRPTDHLSSQLEVEHNKHLIWLSIMIVKWTLFIDLIMGIINIQSKKELVNALQLCFLHRRSVAKITVENLVILVIQETFLPKVTFKSCVFP